MPVNSISAKVKIKHDLYVVSACMVVFGLYSMHKKYCNLSNNVSIRDVAKLVIHTAVGSKNGSDFCFGSVNLSPTKNRKNPLQTRDDHVDGVDFNDSNFPR